MKLDSTKADSLAADVVLPRVLISLRRLQASELRSSPRAWKVWGACIDLTAGHGKAADTTYAAHIADLAKVTGTRTSRVLREFTRLGILRWKAGEKFRSMGKLSLPVEGRPCPECGEEVHLVNDFGEFWVHKNVAQRFVSRTDSPTREAFIQVMAAFAEFKEHRPDADGCPWYAPKGEAPWD